MAKSLRLANMTTHHQSGRVRKWRELGYDIDPSPRCPTISFESSDKWNETSLAREIVSRILGAKRDGFEAILVGGLSNIMCYAYVAASLVGMKVIMGKTPRRVNEGIVSYKLEDRTELVGLEEVTKWTRMNSEP